MLTLVNPTGGPVRHNDAWGSGEFMARRSHGKHQGVDLVCNPGQEVLTPVDGVFKRKLFVYNNDLRWTGLEIAFEKGIVKLFYVDPDTSLLGKDMIAGEVIGTAQNISEKYGNNGTMIPHVHIELWMLQNPMLFFERSPDETH